MELSVFFAFVIEGVERVTKPALSYQFKCCLSQEVQNVDSFARSLGTKLSTEL